LRDLSGKLTDLCVGAGVSSQDKGERWGTQEGAVVDYDCQCVSRVSLGSILAVHQLQRRINDQCWNQENPKGPPGCDLSLLTKQEPPLVFRNSANRCATCKGTLALLGVVEF
jgi:hypothetical protein